jgi:hypothetical protein
MMAYPPGLPVFSTLFIPWILAVAAGILLMARILSRHVSMLATVITSLLILAGTNYFHELFFGPRNETAWLFLLYLAVTVLSSGQKWTLSWPGLFLFAPLTWLIFRLYPPGMFILLFPLMALMLQPGTGEWKRASFTKEGLKMGFLVLIFISCFILRQFPFYAGPMGVDFASFARSHLLINPSEIHRVLFSVKNGWVIYTPLVLAAFAGYYFLAEANRPLYLASFLFFLINVFSVSTRTLPWYDRSLGNPALVSTYAILCLPLGFLVDRTWKQGLPARIVLVAVSVMLITLNLFQTWQFERRIIVPERMTGSYYCAVFGKTSVSGADSLLLKPVVASNADSIPAGLHVSCKSLESFDFEHPDAGYGTSVAEKAAHTGKYGLVLNEGHGFSPGLQVPLQSLAGGDSCWVRAGGYFYYTGKPGEIKGYLVITCVRNGKPFKYSVTNLMDPEFGPDRWNRVSMTYRVPFPAGPQDLLQVYFMNYGKKEFFVDDIAISLCKAGN